MVAMSEPESTFWGVCLEAGKKYSQTVEKCFHISMAAVDPHKSKGSEPVTLYLEKDKVEYVICTLVPGSLNQQQLDLNFNAGEDINLFIKEKGSLHLTGYLVEEDMMDDFSEGEDFEDMEDEDEEEEESVQGKRKLKQITSDSKKRKIESFIDDEAEECEEEEEDDDELFEMTGDEDDDDEEMPEVPQKKDKKKEKKGNQNGEKKKEPVESEKSSEGTPGEKKKKKKKKKNKNKEEQTPEAPKAAEKPKKRMLKGGVAVEDTKEGHGPEATNGKKVMVYYTGKLQSGKVFDSSTSGKPFNFKLGKKEVIPGWEVGIAGMKVGGKRTITVPANMGYGNKAQGPIPANSTLIFDVELKGVN